MRLSAVRWFAAQGRKLDDDIPTEMPKPYTTPPGFKPPTIGEQWRYAVMKHPYYRYGYAAAILFGVIGFGIATSEKKYEDKHPKHSTETK